ncbi:P1 family peptidase [Ruegeria sp.]|uniref:DmpA family aminopeptidase n=1 Tax=Ruegeria sp. TaxID=1879320 RepID=UPI002316D13A|nr:P1 family peptidase [Ruegeria sp.]MDA7966845.1 P1 family peptidase [Ruegeria sp.]
MTDPKPRARDLGLPFPGTPGPLNAITDVAGVHVGFTTLTDPSKNMRTGVTAIIPRGGQTQPQPVWAGQYDLNGNGEMTGTHWINDAGYFFGPVCITNTHGVGMVHHAATRWMIDTYADYFRDEHAWAMPVVAETYDGVMNDINAQFVTAQHALDALNAAAPGPVAEGCVGGGNGMMCYEFKGGTGTSSRILEIDGTQYTIAALVQANHGIRPWLNILGKPVGQMLTENRLIDRETGSIIVILGTDAPLSQLSLRHVAKRAAIGIGRGGSPGGSNSGDIFLAFSVANPGPMPQMDGAIATRPKLNGEWMDPLYLAAVESVEEAVVNAMVAAEDAPTFKPAGRICSGIDRNRLRAIFS